MTDAKGSPTLEAGEPTTYSIKGLVETILKDHGVDIVEVDDDCAHVRLPGQTGISTLRFDSLQRVLLSSTPDRWAEIADQHVRIALDAGRQEIGVPRLDDLLPRVGAASSDRSPASPWEEWIVERHLSLRLVVDLPNAVRFVRPLDLAQWKLSLQDAKERALDNLVARTPEGTLEPVGRNTWQVSRGDSYDATRLLLTETWFPDHPGVFVVVPARDLLLLVPATNKNDVRRAAEVWAGAMSEADRLPYPVSKGLFWFSPGREPRAIRVEREGDVTIHLPEDVAFLLDEQ